MGKGPTMRHTPRSPPWHLTPIQQRVRLKAPPVAFRAERVCAVAREQHAHMHLVSLRLQPPEIALHAVPSPRPPVFGVLAVAGLALNEVVLPFLGKLRERHVGRNSIPP